MAPTPARRPLARPGDRVSPAGRGGSTHHAQPDRLASWALLREMLTAAELKQFEREGVLLVKQLVDPATLAAVRAAVMALETTENAFKSGWPRLAGLGGHYTTVATMFQFRPLLSKVEQVVGGPAQCCGGEMLDKSLSPATASADSQEGGSKGRGSNWAIQWHQDTGIYVDQLRDSDPRTDRVMSPPPVYRTKGQGEQLLPSFHTDNSHCLPCSLSPLSDILRPLPSHLVLVSEATELARNVTCRLAIDDQPAARGPLGCVHPPG